MDAESKSEVRAARRVRWWWLAVIVVAGGALLGGLQLPDVFPDDAHRNLATLAAMGLVAGLLTLWSVLGTGLSGRQQVRSLLGVALAVALAVCLVRVEGCSGNLTPRLTWRWKPKPDESLATVGDEKSSVAFADVADLTATGEHDFPQFLGPDRDATIEAPDFGTDWSAHPPRLLWQQPIGAGWSSFAVVGDYAITQEQRGNDECVTCYALDGGKLLWTHADPGRFSHPMSGDGPRATPTVDEGRVYTLGAFGRLNCLDGRSGKLVWTHDIVKESDASLPQWGKSCSPLVVGGLVAVSAGGPKGWSLVAYDKQTGEVVWHAGDAPSSYASPRLAEVAGVPQLLMVNANSVAGHDPDDGRVLWKFKWPGGQPKVPDAVALGGDQVFISAGYGLGCKLLEIGPSDEGGSPRVVWESNKLKPKFTNVVVRDGYVYGLDDGRTLNCLALNDGKVRWRGGRYGHGQILLVNDLLLVQAESGQVALVKASSERFTELTRFAALQGQTWNNPVVTGRLLLVRNATEAACYDLGMREE